MTTEEVAAALHLDQRGLGRPHHIMACSATTGDGLREALEWVRENAK